jgi:hypothetical protein
MRYIVVKCKDISVTDLPIENYETALELAQQCAKLGFDCFVATIDAIVRPSATITKENN